MRPEVQWTRRFKPKTGTMSPTSGVVLDVLGSGPSLPLATSVHLLALLAMSSKAHSNTPANTEALSSFTDDDATDERQGLLSGEPAEEAELPEHPLRKKRILALIGAGFITLLLAAVFGPPLLRASRNGKARYPVPGEQLQSNGTHDFRRTVLLVSIDGLRAEYLERGLSPHLLEISKKGLRAKYMQPIFPVSPPCSNVGAHPCSLHALQTLTFPYALIVPVQLSPDTSTGTIGH
jgi:hypothetical protein